MTLLIQSSSSSSSKIRSFLLPCLSLLPTHSTRTFSTAHSASSSSSSSPPSFLPFLDSSLEFTPNLVASSFKEWFKHAKPYTVFDQIFAIISSSSADDKAADSSLSQLNLLLDEVFVLDALRHRPHRLILPATTTAGDNNNRSNSLLLLRLKFFDWAGRQQGYRHTRATYHAIFKLLSRARLMSVVVDWLQAYAETRHHHQLFLHRRNVRFHDTLVMGYAVAGKPDVALQLYARMRFQGLDLDVFSYHILLNSLVEESAFDVADAVLSQISARGLGNPVTSCIKMKSLCKQNKLEEAKNMLRELEESSSSSDGHCAAITDRTIGVLVDALCRKRRFEEASELVEEFGRARTYGVWIRDLIGAGRVDRAIEFLYGKKSSEGFVPEVFSYNKLIYQLLRESRLDKVYDVLVEMREEGISPDRFTMNAALCFFCKAGMVDVAIQLYNSRLEFGLTPNSLAYNHLINALCSDGSVDEACEVLDDSLSQGYFPGKRTFHFLTDLLCREGRLDKVAKLLDLAVQRDSVTINAACARYVAALCKAGKVEEGYLASQKVSGTKNSLSRYAYTSLIRGFMALGRGGMVCKLLIEMQERGHSPTRKLYREVICSLCEMGSLYQVLNLLDMQLSLQVLDRRKCYNYFMDGAGHAKKPELARQLFERLLMEGIEPNQDTKILMLQSYLKSCRIGDSLNYFYDMCKGREPSNRLYNILIVGLCKAGKPEQALVFWREVREKGLVPSLQCYEELVLMLCSCGDYHAVVKVLEDFGGTDRQVSSFICNVLLLHTLKTQELRQAWVKSGTGKEEAVTGEVTRETPQSGHSMLEQLVSAFSGGIRMKHHLDKLEEVVENSFPVDIFTYNMLLRGLSMAGRMDYACDLFHRISQKGHEPNRWTFDIIVHGFCKQGRGMEAEKWMDEMHRSGFYPTWYTMDLYSKIGKG